MAEPDQNIIAVSAFTDWTAVASPAVGIDVIEDRSIAGITAFAATTDDVAARLAERYGVTPPEGTRRIVGDGGIVLQWAGPRQWLMMAPANTTADLEADVSQLLDGLAAVVDHTDARALLRISGPETRAVLAKVVGIDLHPRAFAIGDVAVTHAAHVGITIALVDDQPTFEISLSRSFADSFAAALVDAAAAFVHAG